MILYKLFAMLITKIRLNLALGLHDVLSKQRNSQSRISAFACL